MRGLLGGGSVDVVKCQADAKGRSEVDQLCRDIRRHGLPPLVMGDISLGYANASSKRCLGEA